MIGEEKFIINDVLEMLMSSWSFFAVCHFKVLLGRITYRILDGLGCVFDSEIGIEGLSALSHDDV